MTMTSGPQLEHSHADAELMALHRVLEMQLATYDRLEVLFEQKRDSIRAADGDTLDAVTCQEREAITQLQELERQRRVLIARLGRSLGEEAPPATLRELIDLMDDEQAKPLQEMAGHLRERVEQVSRMASVLREATETLSRHIGGIIQTVRGAMNQTRRYGAHGSLAVDTAAESYIDVKS